VIAQQAVYLLVITAILLHMFLEQDAAAPESARSTLKKWYYEYRSPLVHFLMGALLNLYAIFYFKSSSLLVSFGFLGLLVVVLLANELRRVKSLGLPFKFALLIFATVIGFRMMRDAWFICIVAAACMADFPANDEERQPAETWYEWSALAVVLIVAGFLFARDTGFNRAGLDAQISRIFPVNAANYLRQHPQPGPLYNAFDWGGFLIWYMPDYPVAIDGRADLYGDELNDRFYAAANGDNSYATDPYLDRAGVVLLFRDMPLSALLSSDPRFQKIYEDSLAVMFVRQPHSGTAAE